MKPLRWQEEQTQVMIQKLDGRVFQNGDPGTLAPYRLGEERSIEEWAANAGLAPDRHRNGPI